MAYERSDLYPIGGSTRERDVIANVVFVHGLGGHHEETWQCNPKDPETLWTKWLYDDLNKKVPVNVWSLGYPAETFHFIFFSKSRDDSVPQRARNLIDILLSAGIAERPIIFITHSLGGIIVKQILRSSVDARHLKNSSFRKFALSTRLVLFLAVPNTGSVIAKLAGTLMEVKDMVAEGLVSTVDWLPGLPGFAIKWLARRVVKRGTFTAALERGDPYLEDLTIWYRDNAPELGVTTKSYYENAPTKRVAVVVTKEAANIGVGEIASVDADHITICKPIRHIGQGSSHYDAFAVPVIDAVRQSPTFRETHLAVLDVGIHFKSLSEVHPAERMIATKKVVQPIEVRLGRTDPVDYDLSSAGDGPMKVEPWQEQRAATSEYDLDRVILYVWYEYHGMPVRERTMFIRQERERLNAMKTKQGKLSLIPVHYAARALLAHKERSNVQLTQNEKAQVQSTLEFVNQLAATSGMDEGRETRKTLEALLK